MFLQQLARKSAEYDLAYNTETERLANQLVAAKMEEFMRNCHQRAEQGSRSCDLVVGIHNLNQRSGGGDLVVQKFKERMAELGLPNGVEGPGRYYAQNVGPCSPALRLTANWEAEEVAACRVEEPMRGGTRIDCPVCYEHRPAVALMPCGHVICRDCHRCQQIRQCPMCRTPTHSATQGLFMN
ncbi:unnamed protein product [Durusdinium trenchii]|uniref:RING-type domain-containing protein n=1 Tax=Durusdinium trenchii TaxID=1381693 RepID=A0ABP0IWI9_9DINO